MSNSAETKKLHALYMRERGKRVKAAAFALLGNVCVKCGFADTRALQVDHKFGRQPGEKKNQGGPNIYSRILTGKRGVEDLQLLCANCNAIKVWENDERKRKY